MGKLVLTGSWLYKRQVAKAVLERMLVCLRLLAAYLIRFEGALERHFVEQFANLLPWVVSIKLATLFGLGVYRSIWRYMGTSDLLRLSIASTLGSILAAACIQVVFRAEGGAPRAVFLIDWLVVTLLLVAGRMSFVLIREVLARLRRRDLTRVLIVGAGDTGELVLRMMARSKTHAYRVVGFLDDDPGKRDRAIHGVRVLGSSKRLREIIERERVDEVVVAMADADQRVAAECGLVGVACRDVPGFFHSELESEGQPVGAGAR